MGFATLKLLDIRMISYGVLMIHAFYGLPMMLMDTSTKLPQKCECVLI